MATIKDVARAAGVSVTTVSAAINDSAPVSTELRARVQAAIATVGYTPNPVARNLRLGHSRQIGLLTSDLTDTSHARFTETFQRELARRGYGLLLGASGHTCATISREIDRMNDDKIAGLAVILSPFDEPLTPEHLIRFHGPVIAIGGVPPALNCDSINDDHIRGARLMIRHLLQLGHRAITVIAGQADQPVAQQRLEALAEAFQEAGYPLSDGAIARNHPREEQAFRAAQNIMSQTDRPSAIITIHRPQTLGTVKALRSLNMTTPEDVSLISFDDTSTPEGFQPEITSLEPDVAGMAEAATEMMLMRLKATSEKNAQAGSAPQIVRLPPGLSIRSSTRAIQPIK